MGYIKKVRNLKENYFKKINISFLLLLVLFIILSCSFVLSSVPTGYRPPSVVTPNPVVGPPVCGDGLIRHIEECDDGNLINNDGCSNSCLIELDWECEFEPSVCNRKYYELNCSALYSDADYIDLGSLLINYDWYKVLANGSLSNLNIHAPKILVKDLQKEIYMCEAKVFDGKSYSFPRRKSFTLAEDKLYVPFGSLYAKLEELGNYNNYEIPRVINVNDNFEYKLFVTCMYGECGSNTLELNYDNLYIDLILKTSSVGVFKLISKEPFNIQINSTVKGLSPEVTPYTINNYNVSYTGKNKEGNIADDLVVDVLVHYKDGTSKKFSVFNPIPIDSSVVYAEFKSFIKKEYFKQYTDPFYIDVSDQIIVQVSDLSVAKYENKKLIFVGSGYVEVELSIDLSDSNSLSQNYKINLNMLNSLKDISLIKLPDGYNSFEDYYDSNLNLNSEVKLDGAESSMFRKTVKFNVVLDSSQTCSESLFVTFDSGTDITEIITNYVSRDIATSKIKINVNELFRESDGSLTNKKLFLNDISYTFNFMQLENYLDSNSKSGFNLNNVFSLIEDGNIDNRNIYLKINMTAFFDLFNFENYVQLNDFIKISLNKPNCEMISSNLHVILNGSSTNVILPIYELLSPNVYTLYYRGIPNKVELNECMNDICTKVDFNRISLKKSSDFKLVYHDYNNNGDCISSSYTENSKQTPCFSYNGNFNEKYLIYVYVDGFTNTKNVIQFYTSCPYVSFDIIDSELTINNLERSQVYHKGSSFEINNFSILYKNTVLNKLFFKDDVTLSTISNDISINGHNVVVNNCADSFKGIAEINANFDANSNAFCLDNSLDIIKNFYLPSVHKRQTKCSVYDLDIEDSLLRNHVLSVSSQYPETKDFVLSSQEKYIDVIMSVLNDDGLKSFLNRDLLNVLKASYNKDINFIKNLGAVSSLSNCVDSSTFLVEKGETVTNSNYKCASCGECNDLIKRLSGTSAVIEISSNLKTNSNCLNLEGISSLNLNCNGKQIQGGANGVGVNFLNSNDVVLKNCEFVNFLISLNIKNSSNLLIDQNRFTGFNKNGLYLAGTSFDNLKISNNFFKSFSNTNIVIDSDSNLANSNLVNLFEFNNNAFCGAPVAQYVNSLFDSNSGRNYFENVALTNNGEFSCNNVDRWSMNSETSELQEDCKSQLSNLLYLINTTNLDSKQLSVFAGDLINFLEVKENYFKNNLLSLTFNNLKNFDNEISILTSSRVQDLCYKNIYGNVNFNSELNKASLFLTCEKIVNSIIFDPGFYLGNDNLLYFCYVDEDLNDSACCDFENACVYNGVCYGKDTILNADLDYVQERCEI